MKKFSYWILDFSLKNHLELFKKIWALLAVEDFCVKFNANLRHESV